MQHDKASGHSQSLPLLLVKFAVKPKYYPFKLALLQLIEQGLVDGEAPVEIIVPEVANPVVVDDVLSESSGYKPAQGKILIKHLLNHTSGLYLSKVGRATPEGLPHPYTSKPYKGNHSVAQFFTVLRVSVHFKRFWSDRNLTLRRPRDRLAFRECPSPLNLALAVSKIIILLGIDLEPNVW